MFAPTYIRGQAYLAAGKGKEAAVEFQKILDRSGMVWNRWAGALAHLGVACANALQAKNSRGADADAARVRALPAYKGLPHPVERRRLSRMFLVCHFLVRFFAVFHRSTIFQKPQADVMSQFATSRQRCDYC